MNEPWATTQSRLKKWQKESPTAWNLRRVLSDSEHFNFIAKNAAKRASNRPDSVSWQDWWAFYLERLTEKEAIVLLLDVWNKDIWAHLQHQIRAQAHDMLSEIAQRVQTKSQFNKAYVALMKESQERLEALNQANQHAARKKKSIQNDVVDASISPLSPTAGSPTAGQNVTKSVGLLGGLPAALLVPLALPAPLTAFQYDNSSDNSSESALSACSGETEKLKDLPPSEVNILLNESIRARKIVGQSKLTKPAALLTLKEPLRLMAPSDSAPSDSSSSDSLAAPASDSLLETDTVKKTLPSENSNSPVSNEPHSNRTSSRMPTDQTCNNCSEPGDEHQS